MFSRLIEYFKQHEGVEFVTMEQICDDFKLKNPPILPAERGAVLRWERYSNGDTLFLYGIRKAVQIELRLDDICEAENIQLGLTTRGK